MYSLLPSIQPAAKIKNVIYGTTIWHYTLAGGENRSSVQLISFNFISTNFDLQIEANLAQYTYTLCRANHMLPNNLESNSFLTIQ